MDGIYYVLRSKYRSFGAGVGRHAAVARHLDGGREIELRFVGTVQEQLYRGSSVATSQTTCSGGRVIGDGGVVTLASQIIYDRALWGALTFGVD